jgi:hypothetical protein
MQVTLLLVQITVFLVVLIPAVVADLAQLLL